MVEAGLDVTYVAPPPTHHPPRVRRIVVDRTAGRRRIRSWMQVARAVRRCRGDMDLVLVHDLELVLPIRLARPGVPLVWDVHEDVVASVGDRHWVPSWAVGTVRRLVAAVEWFARRKTKLILAETSYAERLGPWPVVPNSTRVPPTPAPYDPDPPPRVVYLGRISAGRGLEFMLDIARALGDEVRVDLIGEPDEDVRDEVEAAAKSGLVRWTGYLPNPEALEEVRGALCGLCLLSPLPNYVGSMPTKIFEYLAHGVPVISTPLPEAVAVVEASGAGALVDYGDVAGATDVIRRWASDPSRRESLGRSGHAWLRQHHDWERDGNEFVALLTTWARARE
jgi:glycosyltransferase involved in cell wall biosynthesis